MRQSLEFVERMLISYAFKIGAIKCRPEEPFDWASGWKSPIYNDNRMFLAHSHLRKLIVDGLEHLAGASAVKFDFVAGTSTAGIPHGYGLADRLDLPFIYVRDKPKDHGMRNQIEGIDANEDLRGSEVVLIEDLVSTGGSSVSAVQAIRNAGGSISHCLSIFSYGFPKAASMFAAEIPFKDGQKLQYPCTINSIIKYPKLIEFGIKERYIKKDHAELLHVWSSDPEGWSMRWKENHPEQVNVIG